MKAKRATIEKLGNDDVLGAVLSSFGYKDLAKRVKNKSKSIAADFDIKKHDPKLLAKQLVAALKKASIPATVLNTKGGSLNHGPFKGSGNTRVIQGWDGIAVIMLEIGATEKVNTMVTIHWSEDGEYSGNSHADAPLGVFPLRRANTIEKFMSGAASDLPDQFAAFKAGASVKTTAAKKWFVVRVDGDDKDTHAGETIEKALELAGMDSGSKYEVSVVEHDDPGAARLMFRKGKIVKKGVAGSTIVVAVDTPYKQAARIVGECLDLLEKINSQFTTMPAEIQKEYKRGWTEANQNISTLLSWFGDLQSALKKKL